MKYMTDHEAKSTIIEIGKRMYAKNFVAANDGNISCRVDDNIIWTTPTGVSKGFISEDMLVKMDLDGNILMGKLKPSSEIKMHIRVYKENPEVNGVTHAHPPICTAYSIAGIALDKAIYPEALVNLGTVPVAHYATPGTDEVPDSIAPYCKDYNAVLLANHGALSWGKTLMEAWYRMEALEHYAMILMYTGKILQKENILSCDQVNELIEIRQSLGISAGGVPPCALKPTNINDVVTSHSIITPEHRELKTYTPGGCGCSTPQPAKESTGLSSSELSSLIERITKEVVSAIHSSK